MKVTLAIATSTPQVGVAVAGPDGLLAEITARRGRRHAEVLAPAIKSALAIAGAGPGDIGLVAVDVGPGLFTGLRVGVASAKALASALGVEVVACTSLEVLAHAQRGCGLRVVAVVDARRGEVFWARYERVAGGGVLEQVGEPAVSSPEVLAAELEDLGASGESALVTGDGARRYSAALSKVVGVEIAGAEHDHPRAASLLELAASLPSTLPEKVMPLYVRPPDVRIGWESRND